MALRFAAGTESLRTAGSFAELSVGTVCMWFRPRTVTGNNRLIGTDTNWEGRLSGADMLHEFRQNAQPNMTTVFATNIWYHVAFTFNGTNKGAYVNAVADPVFGPYAHNAAGADTILSVGTSTWNAAQGMAGDLEDLRMYSRVLSTAEVELIYNGNGRDGLLNGLQHWWHLNRGAEGAVSTGEIDVVGNVNLSTVVGSPTYVASPRSFIRGAA